MKKIALFLIIVSMFGFTLAKKAQALDAGIVSNSISVVNESTLLFRFKAVNSNFTASIVDTITEKVIQVIPAQTIQKSADNDTKGTLVTFNISRLAPKTQFEILVLDGQNKKTALFTTLASTKPKNTAKLSYDPIVGDKKITFRIESEKNLVDWKIQDTITQENIVGPVTTKITSAEKYVLIANYDVSSLPQRGFNLVVNDSDSLGGVGDQDFRYFSLDPKATPKTDPVNVDPNKDSGKKDDTYHLLAPIPGMKEDFVDGSQQIGDYINNMFKIFLGLCAALAVIMIIIYGVTWMGTDSVFGKTEAKGKIGGAIGGLLLALGAWVILNTINPDLLGGSLNIKQASIELEGDAESPVSINRGDATKIGLTCDHAGGKNDIPSTAKSFSGKMTYSQDLPKGQVVNNKIKLDCSGYINYVLQCVGINTSDLGINSGTSTIFSGAEKVDSTKTYPTSINGVELNIGDLVGWRAGDNTGKYAKSGHVMIYIGGGLVADSHSGSSDAFGSFSLTKYKDQIKFIKRL
jgi:type IV secretory pathway VirB2 component (pilin)